MNIRAGLIAAQKGWEELLRQEGLPSGTADLNDVPDPSHWSVLVITRLLTPRERENVARFLGAGGAILGAAKFCAGIGGTTTRPARLRYLTGGEKPAGIEAVGMLDLDCTGEIPREAEYLRTQDGASAVQAGDLAGGIAVLLPFDPGEATEDHRAAVRMFPSRRERLPWERVSRVAKGEVRHLVRLSLEYLHHQRGIPYVHLWYYPDAAPAVLGFRVDTDGAGRSDLMDQYAVARSRGIGCTWFVDVGRALDQMSVFRMMEGQEFGVHCHAHQVLTDESRAADDIGRAIKEMEGAGFAPRGCAAPYGFWSPGYARAMSNLGLAYTSEFACAYDTLPLRPAGMGGTEAPLQIPVHPVCPGSLTRAGADERSIADYLRARIDTALDRHEPVILYHHPSHRAWDAVNDALGYARDRGAVPVTLLGYAEWWKERAALSPGFSYNGHTVSVEGVPVGLSRRCMVRITDTAGRETLMESGGSIDLRSARWQSAGSWRPPPDLGRTREADLRTSVAALYTALLRRRR